MSDSLTVIVPTRDRTQYLQQSVPSVLASAARAKREHGLTTRVLVVDDAPHSDLSRDLARALGVDYARVPVHDGLRDPGAARVLGVQSVDTRLLSIFDDDDVMTPEHLPAVCRVLAEGADVVSSSFWTTDADLVPVREVVLAPSNLADLVAGITPINDNSVVPHDLVRDLDWDVTLEGQMLVPLWCELMLQGKDFRVVTTPTWYYRRHGGNLSMQALSERDQMLRAAARRRARDRCVAVLGEVPTSAGPEGARAVDG